jgi:hypothetical protein
MNPPRRSMRPDHEDNLANLIEQSASRLIESSMSDEDDYVGEFGLSNGSGPIGIRTFPGAHWNRRTKLPSSISGLSRIGGEALHDRGEIIGAIRIYVPKKCGRGNQAVPLTIVGKIHRRHCTTNFEKCDNQSSDPYRKSPLTQCLNQSTHLRHEIPTPAGTA